VIAWIVFVQRGLMMYRFGSVFEMIALVGFQFSLPLAVVAIACRRRFLRLEIGAQRTMACIALLLPVGLYGSLILHILFRL
jgi:hypothetical protein